MRITNVEFITDQGSGRLNEDQYLVQAESGLFAVFDGVSSNPYVSEDGKTGGLIAAETVRDAFSTNSTSLENMALYANNVIESIHKRLHINTALKAGRFGSTVAGARVSEQSIDMVQIADTIVLVQYDDGRILPPMGYSDHDAEVLAKYQKLVRQGKPNPRAKVQEDLNALKETANINFGVLNGEPAVRKFLKHITLPLAGIRLVMLLTDGMFLPKADTESSEDWKRLVDIYRAGGLRGIVDQVRDLENSDPTLGTYPRYKLHDDATAIALEFA